MNYAQFHEHCLTNAVPVSETGEKYGLLVEIKENEVVMVHGNKSFVVKKNEIESIYELRMGLWASFWFANKAESVEFDRNCSELQRELVCEKKIEKVNIRPQTKFPDYDVTNGVLSVISKVAIPYSDYDFLPFGINWRRMAWSTEWGAVGDPYFLFARFDPNLIYWGRLEYRPAKQPCSPYNSYHWELMKVNNCMDHNLQALIVRAPWNAKLATDSIPVQMRTKSNASPNVRLG